MKLASEKDLPKVKIAPKPESPVMMDEWLDLFFVERLNFFHRRRRQRFQIRSRKIFSDLRRTFRAGNRAGDGGKFQNPAQRKLRQRNIFWRERFQFPNRAQTGFKIHAGKSFAAVKSLAVAIERAMVVFFKFAFARDFAGQHS